jgi:hypothetical protein
MMKYPNLSKWQILLVTVACVLVALCPIQFARSQGSSNTAVSIVPQLSSPRVGETFTVNITISNVQNLYGLDVTLNWNTSVLHVVQTQSFLGIESNPIGVLHNPISIVEDSASQEAGEYHLVATSLNPAAPSNGNGNIATLTFNVTNPGQTELTLNSELANHPATDEVATPIDHTDVSGLVETVTPSSSPFPTVSSSPFPTATPEFSSILFIALLIGLTTTILVLFKRAQKKNQLN